MNANDLDRLGIRPGRGSLGQPAGNRGKATNQPAIADQSLSYEFPSYRNGEFGFVAVPVAAGLSMSAAGTAWFGLQSFRVPEDTNGEVYWTGYKVAMMGCDVAGTGLDTGRFPAPAGGYLAWGDVPGSPTLSRNLHAHLVIGVNLPITFQQWREGPTLFPGIANVGDGRIISRRELVQRVVLKFPPGLFPSTSIPAQVREIENKLPTSIRLVNGMRLDVALVVMSSLVRNKASECALAGHVLGSVTFGQRFADTQFTPVA